jgi:hypothetical protein
MKIESRGFAFFLGDDLMGRGWERHWCRVEDLGSRGVLDLLVKGKGVVIEERRGGSGARIPVP